MPSNKRPPNVIIIIADDQGYGDIGCHGNDKIKTPNLDRLAATGVEFTRFYVTPVCSPTRASLMTGRYCYRTGVWETYMGGEVLRLDEVTIPELLAAAGYRTGIFGKWHLGEVYPYVPSEQGFEDGLYFRHGNSHYFDITLERNLKPVPTKGYLTDIFTDAAIEFVEENRNRPFFLYLAYNAPHTPLELPESYLEPYASMGLDDTTAKIYGMITCIDHNVGRLLAKLDELEIADDTIVIFFGDNGPQQTNRYNCGLRRNKGTVYEGGIRVPFLIRWKGRWQGGRKIDSMAANIDLLPTILDACGVPLPNYLKIDGVSLLPLLDGTARDLPDRMLFFHWQRRLVPEPYPNGAVMTPRFKLVNGTELYDLLNDIGETRDISAQHPEIVAELRKAYENWWRDVTSERGFTRPPCPVGCQQENPSRLFAMHAITHGEIKYEYGQLTEDRLFNWTTSDDFVEWELDVFRGGLFQVDLYCRCTKAGGRLRVTVGDQSFDCEISPTAGAGSWSKVAVARVALDSGRGKLTIKPATGADIELNRVELTRLG